MVSFDKVVYRWGRCNGAAHVGREDEDIRNEKEGEFLEILRECCGICIWIY